MTWMNNYGISDRNYVDSALFRSISVEKGPSLTRGVKSGVGGSVAVRTIEPEDVIPEGKTWGIQLKGDFSEGPVKPHNTLMKYLGTEDYRTIPERPAADAGSGLNESTGDRFSGLYFDNAPLPQKRTHKLKHFKNDRAGMVAAAFKTKISDGLIAYSDREKGNYNSGKRGAGGYLSNPEYDSDQADYGNTGASMIPNMAKLYAPGEEVFNTNTASKSLLLKNSWHLPANQKITLSHMRNRIRFGENNPFYTALMLGFSYDYNMLDKSRVVYPIQGLESNIDTKAYRIGYEWKPENNPWIDLQANIWRINTDSTRHQSGGSDLAVTYGDNNYDNWVYCNIRHRLPDAYRYSGSTCADLIAQGLVPSEEPKEKSQVKGSYRVKSGAEQRTKVSRTGADISNLFRLSDKLKMTLSANVQHEKVDEHNEIHRNDKDLFDILGSLTTATAVAGPRAGRRCEPCFRPAGYRPAQYPRRSALR